MPPGIHDKEDEEDEAEAQERHRPRPSVPEFPEAADDFSKVHAEANLHHFRQAKKGSGAISRASIPPIEGPLLQRIQVPDKQNHQE